MTSIQSASRFVGLILVLCAACSPRAVSPSASPSSSPDASTSVAVPVTAATDASVGTTHLSKPADVGILPPSLINDVDSSGTGPEKRAPYGDSYGIDRFERPFLKDMTYVPDLDILGFGLSQDPNWYYVSMQLVGNNPNDQLDIRYGVELDTNGDGFGDAVLWAHPLFTTQWQTSIVQVFQDLDQDISKQFGNASRGDGYEKLIFDGASADNADPDLAWARMVSGNHAVVQFAFKKSWIGSKFAFRVVADGGLKNLSEYDYSHWFSQIDAGSPVRSSKYYPLGSLYGVDNTCWEAYHIRTKGNELMFCPATGPAPTRKPKNSCTPAQVSVCQNGYDPSTCLCN